MSTTEHPSTPMLCDIDRGAHELSLSTKEVRRLIQRGELRSVKIGRRRLIPAGALADYCAALEADG